MALPEPLLDTAKLLEQLRELGAIGHDAAQGGRTRIALTDEEKAGRDLLVRWMRELDLEVRVDQIGNIFGVLHADHPQGMAQPLMMGSHIDTVRNAGALDGCYGVLAGLAVVRAYRQAGLRPARAIVVDDGRLQRGELFGGRRQEVIYLGKAGCFRLLPSTSPPL